MIGKILNPLKYLYKSIIDPLYFLGSISSEMVLPIFNVQDNNKAWENIITDIQNLNLPEMTGGINPGDQRALFYLTCSLKPGRILEIGTHIRVLDGLFCSGIEIFV